MLQIRFVRNFVFTTVETILNPSGKYDIIERQHHAQEDKYWNEAQSYFIDDNGVLVVDFGPGIGVTVNLPPNHLEIYNTNPSGPQNPITPSKCCP
jgi:hypothetical protein